MRRRPGGRALVALGARRRAGASGPWARSRAASRAAGRRARRARRAPRRRRHDAGRQPARVGARAGRVLPLGAVALPCTEQLRAHDLRRGSRRAPAADRVRRAQRAPSCDGGGPEARRAARARTTSRLRRAPPPRRRARARRPVPDRLHLRHGRRAEGGAARPALPGGPALQAERWLDARPGELVWCTAASGWSKSARNAFIAPWLRGAAALLHDARFDPHERLDVLERERVDVLCMAPTEYRVIAKRAAPRALAGAARRWSPPARRSTPRCSRAWHDATGLWIRDGYGQSETGQLTGMPLGTPGPPGLDGPGAPGRARSTRRRRARGRPRHACPTFFLGYLGEAAAGRARGARATASRATPTASSTSRAARDDVIISSGYRIGPFEVESALVAHPAVAEAAVVAAPGRRARQRGARGGRAARRPRPVATRSPRALQDHVKAADGALQVPARRRVRRRRCRARRAASYVGPLCAPDGADEMTRSFAGSSAR